MPNRNISPERKTIYYVGMALIILGFLSFGSVFVTGAMHFGDFSHFESRGRSEAMRGILGMGLMIAGGICMSIGSRGLAGSGVVLDPEKARKDVEPWSRMTGGVIKDALDETGINLNQIKSSTDMPFDEKLRRLHKLHEDGILTKEEYDREKQEILDKN